VKIVAGVSIPVVDAGMIVEVIVSAEVRPRAGGSQAAPERVPVRLAVVKAIGVLHLECRLMGEGKHMRLVVGV